MTAIPLERIGPALGRIPSGIFLCVCRKDGRNLPFIASWVQQASMSPPCLTVAVQETREALSFCEPGKGSLTLSILPAGSSHLMKPFFGETGQDPFGGLDTRRNGAGGVYLAEAMAWIECRVLSLTPAGDHRVVVAEVLDGEVLDSGREPWVHLRKNGLRY